MIAYGRTKKQTRTAAFFREYVEKHLLFKKGRGRTVPCGFKSYNDFRENMKDRRYMN